MKQRVALGIEYNGCRFNGWQIQPKQKTVQGDLEAALSLVADSVICEMQVAGRTDSGVHATEQVVHFDSEITRSEKAWVLGTNSKLPTREISVLWAKPVNDDFHARFSAQRRRYRYVLLSRPVRPTFLNENVAWDYRPFDLARMQEAVQYLLGEHNFNAYRTVKCQAHSPVKTVYYLNVEQDRNFFYFDIEANSFLHHMVRNIVGVLMAIGCGDQEPIWAKEVLDTQDRTLGGVTAPANGLYLTGVSYDEKFQLPKADFTLPKF